MMPDPARVGIQNRRLSRQPQKGKQGKCHHRPSARVDESRIDEEAVARLEPARLERIREEAGETKKNEDNPGATKLTEDGRGTAQLTEESGNRSQPLTRLMPREESPVGDGSTTEVEDEKTDQKEEASAGPQERPTQPSEAGRPSEAWHKNTRPAEPQIPKKWNIVNKEPDWTGNEHNSSSTSWRIWQCG